LSYAYVLAELLDGSQWAVSGDATIDSVDVKTNPCASYGCEAPPETPTIPVMSVEAGTTQTVTEWGVAGSSDLSLILQSSTNESPWTLDCQATHYCASDYLMLSDSTCLGTCYAGSHSTDAGGNTNWIFTDPPPPPTPGPGCCAFSGNNDVSATCVDNIVTEGDPLLSLDMCQMLSQQYLSDDPVLYFNPDSNCSPDAGDLAGTCPPPSTATPTATPTQTPTDTPTP
jgi:hypothetical protein